VLFSTDEIGHLIEEPFETQIDTYNRDRGGVCLAQVKYLDYRLTI
jgi:hypothetical protein